MHRSLVPAAVSLVLLAASAARGEEARPALANTIRWSTASEVENFGFDVYRGDTEEGPFARITPTPILGAGTVDTPSQYSYVDDTIEPDKEYFYYVESISMDGEREPFTPVARVGPKPRPAEKPKDDEPQNQRPGDERSEGGSGRSRGAGGE